MKKNFALAILALFIVQNSLAQKPQNTSPLTIEQIMQGERFVGFLPNDISWSEDSKSIYFHWNPEMDTLRSMYKIGIDQATPQKVNVEEMRTKPSRFGNYNNVRTKKVYSDNGDIFVHDIPSGKTIQVTKTFDTWEHSPQFSADENRILFQISNNIFSWKISDGTIAQITNFQKGNKNSKRRLARHDQWLENDQLAYFDILKKRKEQREARKYRNGLLDPEIPVPLYFGDKSLRNLKITPDEKFVTFRLTKRAKNKRTDVPNYVTESGHVEDLISRPKIGSPLDTYETWVYNVMADTAYVLDTEQIEGIYDKPAFLREYHDGEKDYADQYENPREVIIHGPYFSEDSKAVLEVKSMDNKDRWIMLLDLPTGKLKLLDRQRDEAWIGGPGIIGWNSAPGNLGWMPGNESVWFQSEKTGYSHLYTLHVGTGKMKALTSGDFEILDAQISNDQQYFYISSNKETPHQHHFYKMPIKGGKMKKITSQPGNHQVTMSPDEQWLAIRYSYSNRPWELFLMKNEAGAKMKQLTQSTTKAFEKYPWRDPKIVRFKASDNVEVPARIYQPKNPNGAAVIFVHGAGYLQNVHQWWSSYYREYMFHNILADNGYTVLDIDYRASNGYGRDWRTAIYRFMGGKDLDDHIDGAKYLVEQHGIDADRIGIYGGSYGGFITLMALFTKPGTFKSGAALRSVTDWAHYNHPYTSNILNTPVEDSIAFYKSSPIYHAEGLEDHLLILHGMIDTNVQFQDVVRLAQRLIELGKDNWEFAVFPLEYHGFVEASSWADEYKRIFKLFQETLRE